MKQLSVILFLFVTGTTMAQTTNFWVRKADFAGLKRERAVAFSIGDYGYVGTGVDTTETVFSDFWKYDPSLDIWTQVANLPGSVRRNAVAFATSGKGYVGTGINVPNTSDIGAQKLSDFWEYSPVSNTWTQKANFPGDFGQGVYFATGFAIDSKGYICGGKLGPSNYSNELWEYKPSLDQWTQLPNFPGGVRYQLSSFVIDFKAYVGLGTDQDLYRKDIWEFNAATNQWSAKADLPASERAAATTFSIGQRGYVCTGSNGGVLDDLWEYNPFNDDWSIRATYGGSPRKGAVGFTVNGIGYVGTGKGISGKKMSFHAYTPPAILGVNELESALSVYPNPAVDVIKINTNSNSMKSLVLFNVYGKIVMTEEYTETLDISTFTPGTYYLTGIDANGQKTGNHKLIIQ
ncbi:MAG: T9SS type A sorting domain-containing protein [Crocinitomicaceae bacterium]|nr:T9SS type A sorting domain-containing protein [Crocinitomicaceae bacterium]